MDPYYHPGARAMAEYNQLITHYKLTENECVSISGKIRKNCGNGLCGEGSYQDVKCKYSAVTYLLFHSTG